MSKLLLVTAFIGLALAIALIGYYGAGAVWSAFEAVGWGVLIVMGVRAVETSGAGIAWGWLMARAERPPLRIFVLLRWIRESINCLLPVAQVGGDLMGGRLLTFFGPTGGQAGASIIVDMFVQTGSQFIFTVVGVLLLALHDGNSPMVRWVLIGLCIMGPALIAFFAVQRYGGMRFVENLFTRLAQNPKWAGFGGLGSLHACLQATYARRGALFASFALHLLIWFVGVFEIYTALHFMGYAVDYRTALVIESLAQAVRGAGFVVPGAVGVQEGGFIALCAIFGIPAPTAIALSLVKRLPEVVGGIPGLLVWQGLEGRRLVTRRRDGASGAVRLP